MVISFLRRRLWNRLTRKLNNATIKKSVFLHTEATENANRLDDRSQSRPWSVLFFGSDEFALHSFKILNERYRLNLLIKRLEVVTAYKGKENALTMYASQNDIPVHTWPVTVPPNEFDLGLVVSFGHMIPTQMISAFPLGVINVHASLLPKLRGAAPIIHALINGDSETGITIMKIRPEKFDVGEILTQKAIRIDPDETMPELYAKLARTGADLLIKTIEMLPDILNNGREQSDNEATYARKITAKAAIIKWDTMTAKNLYDLQRALTGLYQLTAIFEDKSIKLLGIRVHEGPANFSDLHGRIPGYVVYDKQKNVLLVQCKDETWISIGQIVVPGRRPMSAKDFRNGFMNKYKKSPLVFR